jgi:uncharacterized protein (TIGR04222 family)
VTFDRFDLSGPAFLAFYVFAMLFAHVAGRFLARLCKSSHPAEVATPEVTPLEAAYLAGGRGRVVDASLVSMLRHDVIAVQGSGGAFVAGKAAAQPQSGMQADLYREIARNRGTIEKLRRLRNATVARVETRLANDGLLMPTSGSEALCTRLALGLPVAAVIALGALRLVAGTARGRPVAFLVVLLIVSLIVLGVKLLKLPLRSGKGDAALAKLQRRNAALQATAKRRAADLDDSSLMLAVGLFGAPVLSTGELVWMQKGFVSRQSGADSSSGGCSGGCGGGGCGGCGG